MWQFFILTNKYISIKIKTMISVKTFSTTLNSEATTHRHQKIGSLSQYLQPEEKKPRKGSISVNTTLDSTFDKKSKRRPSYYKIKPKDGLTSLEHSEIIEIFRISDEIESENSNQEMKKLRKSALLTQDSILKSKMDSLFELYIQQEILKHYCGKTSWKFQSQKKLMENLVFPTLDLLSIRKSNIKLMMEPFLQNLSEKYLLHTERDNFSRLSSPALLIEMTEVWVKIKQAQIPLKRQLRSKLSSFKRRFCYQNNGRTIIDRKSLFYFLYENSREIRMVNLMKIFIFIYKVGGSNQDRTLEEWLQQY